MLEAVQVKKTKLKHARAQLQLTQEALAKLAGIARQPLVNAERGVPISQISAWAILNALNRVRADLDMAPLEYEQMDWKVRGDEEEG